MAKRKDTAAVDRMHPAALAAKRRAEAQARQEYYEKHRERMRFAMSTVKGFPEGGSR